MSDTEHEPEAQAPPDLEYVQPRSSVEDGGPVEADPTAAAESPPQPVEEAADPSTTAAPAPPPRPKARFPSLVRAFRAGRAVEGVVEKVIKGGYEIRVDRARAFCPHSQIDLHREDEPERQVGKSYEFRITQLRRGGEDIVLSRRAILEDRRVEESKAVRATLIEGAVMRGRVVSTAEFGAFIDLGAGVLGLAHISELSHNRVNSVEQAVKVGDSVPVRVLKLKNSGRISLSVRRAQDDPSAYVEKRFEIGKSYPGTVQRIADFGVFVELAPGVEALAPASEFPPLRGGWEAELEVGASRDWCVLSVSPKERRVSVTPPGDGSVTPEAVVEGAEISGQVQRIERYGVFVWLAPGRVGLMPRAMTGAGENADLRKSFGIGDRVDVSVVEIEPDGRRIRLRKKGVELRTESDDAPRSRKEPRPEPEVTESFGTSLADKLRAALGEGDRKG